MTTTNTPRRRRTGPGARVAPPGKLTLTQAGLKLGVTRERVRQLAEKGAFGVIERPKPGFVFLDEAAVDRFKTRREETARAVAAVFGVRGVAVGE